MKFNHYRYVECSQRAAHRSGVKSICEVIGALDTLASIIMYIIIL